jgi:glycosyltransferase involved in cell wall biosynthesis
VRNGADLEVFDPDRVDGSAVRRALGAGSDTVVVGTVTRLTEERKGGLEFVEIAKLLARDGTDYRFFVVGDGDLRPELERRAAGLVAFLGEHARPAQYYAAMDVFVLPSHWEGGPITVLEALAMKRPVVATRVGVVPEVITDGVEGIVVPPRDIEALANGVRRLVADPAAAQAMAERGHARVTAAFSTEALVDAYLRLYRDLLRAKARRR